jgi:carboxyl-terminal processing protease
VEQDSQAKVTWSGPLGILINRGSASSSEIFAAAMQDYGRGLVIGDPSYGKGTVQTMVDLDRIAKNEKPRFGELKMTVAQFFRVNGGTTQLRGVTPDIPLKGGSDEGDFGEASYGNALPWTQIKPADYSPNSSVQSLIPALIGRHEARLSVDADMKLLYEDIARDKREREINAISLNEAERRKERDVKEAWQGSRNSADQLAYRDDGLQANERDLAKSLAAEKVRKEAKDIYLMEATRIMSDEIDVLGAEPQLANGNRPSPLAVTSP